MNNTANLVVNGKKVIFLKPNDKSFTIMAQQAK